MQSRKLRPKGGNDPAFGCRVGGRVGRSRPLAVESGAQQDRNQISSVSRTDWHQICAMSIGRLVNKFKIEKGISRITRVKL
jgi:hypothetical protein